MKIRSILCPTDFSEFSGRVLEHAVALARLRGAKLTVVHVYASSPRPASTRQPWRRQVGGASGRRFATTAPFRLSCTSCSGSGRQSRRARRSDE